MEYKTRYNLGDVVWRIYKDRVSSFKIVAIHVSCYTNTFDSSKYEYLEKYSLSNDNDDVISDVNLIFDDKESLLQSL